jgi:hypothetical protein
MSNNLQRRKPRTFASKPEATSIAPDNPVTFTQYATPEDNPVTFPQYATPEATREAETQYLMERISDELKHYVNKPAYITKARWEDNRKKIGKTQSNIKGHGLAYAPYYTAMLPVLQMTNIPGIIVPMEPNEPYYYRTSKIRKPLPKPPATRPSQEEETRKIEDEDGKPEATEKEGKTDFTEEQTQQPKTTSTQIETETEAKAVTETSVIPVLTYLKATTANLFEDAWSTPEEKEEEIQFEEENEETAYMTPQQPQQQDRKLPPQQDRKPTQTGHLQQTPTSSTNSSPEAQVMTIVYSNQELTRQIDELREQRNGDEYESYKERIRALMEEETKELHARMTAERKDFNTDTEREATSQRNTLRQDARETTALTMASIKEQMQQAQRDTETRIQENVTKAMTTTLQKTLDGTLQKHQQQWEKFYKEVHNHYVGEFETQVKTQARAMVQDIKTLRNENIQETKTAMQESAKNIEKTSTGNIDKIIQAAIDDDMKPAMQSVLDDAAMTYSTVFAEQQQETEEEAYQRIREKVTQEIDAQVQKHKIGAQISQQIEEQLEEKVTSPMTISKINERIEEQIDERLEQFEETIQQYTRELDTQLEDKIKTARAAALRATETVHRATERAQQYPNTQQSSEQRTRTPWTQQQNTYRHSSASNEPPNNRRINNPYQNTTQRHSNNRDTTQRDQQYNPYDHQESYEDDDGAANRIRGGGNHDDGRGTANRNSNRAGYDRRKQQQEEHETEAGEAPPQDAYQMNRSLHQFKKEHINVFLDSIKVEPKQLTAMYRTIQYAMQSNNLPILDLAGLGRQDSTLPTEAQARFTDDALRQVEMALYHKLMSVIPETNPTLMNIMQIYSDSQDGYAALYEIMCLALGNLRELPTPWGPELNSNDDIRNWYTTFQRYIFEEQQNGRGNYTEWQITANILQRALPDQRYQMAAYQLKSELMQQCTPTGRIPPRLKPNSIQRIIAVEAIPVTNTPVPAFSISKVNGKPPPRDGPTKHRHQIQCDMCKTWGHDSAKQVCFFCAEVYWTQKYMEQNPEKAKGNADNYAELQNKKCIARMATMDEEQQHMVEHAIVSATQSQHSPELHRQQEPTTPTEQSQKEAPPTQPFVVTKVQYQPLQPFQFQPGLVDDDIFNDHNSDNNNPDQKSNTQGNTRRDQHETQRRIHHLQVNCDRHQLQGDSGANTGATDKLDILWDFAWYQQPRPISTFKASDGEESALMAYGEGHVHMVTNENTTIQWTMMYTPDSGGAVISPQRYLKENMNVSKWNQWGGRKKKGGIDFKDDQDKLISAIDMEEKNGLWYTTNQILVPPTAEQAQPTDNPHLHSEQHIHTITDSSTEPTTATEPTDSDQQDAPPLLARTPTTATNSSEQKTNHKHKQYEQLEIWHQRYGHPGTKTLHLTQKCVAGMPKLPSNHPVFQCRFCDMGKQNKTARGPPSTREHLEYGSQLHIDMGFFSGPSNLEDTIQRGAKPGTTHQTSRQGYNGYMLIVDAATRYAWIFPVKSKHPPIPLIVSFLKKLKTGKKQLKRKIMTSAGGILAQSMEFLAQCGAHGYEMDAVDDIDLPITIRTDGGGELGGSAEARQALQDHNAVMEITGPDSSSQNGLGERPHRTLAEKARCLLYTAGLGIIFGMDALIHAVWLYNRTYHTAIEMTPYQAATGHIPPMDKLLTWGCRVTPKRSNKVRTTKADPHSHHGIFLGYTATDTIIRYWDVHTQREKTAHHGRVDEFQYGDAPAVRSPASKFILETITGTPQQERRSDVLHEPACQVTPCTTTEPMMTDPHQIALDTTPGCIPPTTTEPTYTAAAAKVSARLQDDELYDNIRLFNITLNPYGPSICERLSIQGNHPTAGLILIQDPNYSDTVRLQAISPGTPSAKIPRWRSRLRGAIIRRIGTQSISTIDQVITYIAETRKLKRSQIEVEFANGPDSSTNGQGVPQLHFDQLSVIARHLTSMRNDEIESQNKEFNIETDPIPQMPDHEFNIDADPVPRVNPDTGTFDPTTEEEPSFTNDQLQAAVIFGIATARLTRRKVMATKESDKWQQSEFTQLNKYASQGMFGQPCPRPTDPDTVILPFVWTYLNKIDPATLSSVEKARGTCNGGKRYGKAVTLAETYAACVEQPAQRLYWSLVSCLSLVSYGTDVANAFGEAPPPEKPFYMHVDNQFREWWTDHLGNPPIPAGYVLPVLKNLQGHPEAPRLWHKHIHRILIEEMEFQCTTHETCLYHKRLPNGKMILVLRQVDDFSIAATDKETAMEVRNALQDRMQYPLNDMGLIRRFNGVDISQTRDYVKMSCEMYIDKIVIGHGWQNEPAHTIPVPMRQDSAYHAILETELRPETEEEKENLEKIMGFSYRQAIGELIFAMTVCRLDIATAVIKLSQYSANPTKAHYQAAKQVFVYLYATRERGLYYWRQQPMLELPVGPEPQLTTPPEKLQPYPQADATKLEGYVDTTWGADRAHRRSVTGLAFMLAGAAILYKCKYQSTTALSSTEAEFDGQADAGKAALYLRSILDELGITQNHATTIHADNNGAIQMSNAHQPTKRTRHVAIKSFAILQWTEEDLIKYEKIASAINPSDSLTKMTGRYKFYEHFDILMGYRRPDYALDDPQTAHISSCSAYNLFHLVEDETHL